MYGFREFRLSSLKSKLIEPCHLSAPGCVKISIPPKPGNSFSAENGLSVHAHFANRFFRRDLTVREAVDFHLRAAAFGIGRPGEGLQGRHQRLRIVWQRFEIAAA